MNENLLKRALVDTADEMMFLDYDNGKNDFVPSEKYQAKMKKMLDNYDKTFYRITYTRARKAVCILVAILILMLSSLSVGAVRETIANFFIKNFSTHASVDYEEKVTHTNAYPDKIEKEYELTNIPKGYEMVDNSSTSENVTTIYLSENGQLLFSQFAKKDYVSNIDNVNSVITKEVIDNNRYIIAKSKNSADYNIVWDNGEYVFMLVGNLDKSKMLDLCKTIKIKK